MFVRRHHTKESSYGIPVPGTICEERSSTNIIVIKGMVGKVKILWVHQGLQQKVNVLFKRFGFVQFIVEIDLNMLRFIDVTYISLLN